MQQTLYTSLTQAEETKETLQKEAQVVAVGELNKPGRDILGALSKCRYLTAEQLARYLGVIYPYVQREIKPLVDSKYVLALSPTRQDNFGGAPHVYTLTGKGHKACREWGIEHIKEIYTDDNGWMLERRRRFRASEEKERGGTPFTHTLALQEVLLQTFMPDEDYKIDPQTYLEGYMIEEEFRHDPLKEYVPKKRGGTGTQKGKTIDLRPDLWLRFTHGGYRYCFCIEMNLTPVEQKRWGKRSEPIFTVWMPTRSVSKQTF